MGICFFKRKLLVTIIIVLFSYLDILNATTKTQPVQEMSQTVRGCLHGWQYHGCNCKNQTLTCHSANATGWETLFDQIKAGKVLDVKNITEIKITGGSMPELPANIFGNCSDTPSKALTSLKRLTLRHMGIGFIHGRTFHCMPNLEYLDLSYNQWRVWNMNHTGYFKHFPQLKHLDLTDTLLDRNLTIVHLAHLSHIFNSSSFDNLEELRLGKNDLLTFHEDHIKSLCNAPKLNSLDLQSNNLAKITLVATKNCLPALKKLNLRKNVFGNLDQSTLDVLDQLNARTSLTVDLRENPFDCDCHIKPFVSWMKTTKVTLKSKEEFVCHDGAHFNVHLVSVKDDSLICVPPQTPSSAGVTVVIVLFVLIGVVVAGVMFWKREHMRKFCKRVTKPINTKLSNVSTSYGYSSVSKENLTV